MDIANLPWKDIGKGILALGSLSGLIALPFTVFQSLRSRPKLKMTNRTMSGTRVEENGMPHYQFTHSGKIHNQSQAPNTIVNVFLVLWKNKSKNAAMRFGYTGEQIFDDAGNPVRLPIRFEGKDAKDLTIVSKVPIPQGSVDEPLLRQERQLTPGFSLPVAYDYELMFEDVNENLFGEDGRLHNHEEIDLRWKLANSFRHIEDGNFLPLIQHQWQIFRTRLRFARRNVMQSLGLWK